MLPLFKEWKVNKCDKKLFTIWMRNIQHTQVKDSYCLLTGNQGKHSKHLFILD